MVVIDDDITLLQEYVFLMKTYLPLGSGDKYLDDDAICYADF